MIFQRLLYQIVSAFLSYTDLFTFILTRPNPSSSSFQNVSKNPQFAIDNDAVGYYTLTGVFLTLSSLYILDFSYWTSKCMLAIRKALLLACGELFFSNREGERERERERKERDRTKKPGTHQETQCPLSPFELALPPARVC